MLTALRLSGLRPPEIELDERTKRAFPEFAEKIRLWNEALIAWWKRAAVLIDVGASSGDAGALESLQEQVTALAASVVTLQEAASASAAAGSASSPAMASSSSSSPVTSSAASAYGTTPDELIEWTQTERYRIVSAETNATGHMKSATVRWPDGSMGEFTTLAFNSVHLAIDSFQITHPASGKRVFQPSLVRGSDGSVKSVPNLKVL